MGLNRSRSTAIAALLSAALIGGGVAAVAPAVAEDGAQYVATNWKKIWKKQLRPLADKRYYKKAQSDAKYSTKTETGTALGNYYTKAQSDAGYAQKGASYTKAESDAKYAPYPSLIRGAYALGVNAAGANGLTTDNVSYGVTLTVAPTAHFIELGDPVPVGCSGTPAAPNASDGHLCVFEAQTFGALGATATKGVCTPDFALCPESSGVFGGLVYGYTTGAGVSTSTGTWALRPAAIASGAGAGDAAAGRPAAGLPGR